MRDKNEPIFKILNNVLFCLQIASEISAPLAKTDTIVLLGDDRTTSEVTRLLTNLPPAVQALTGVDLSKVFKRDSEAQCVLFIRTW